jgi:broad specificity phosphatase PhoE
MKICRRLGGYKYSNMQEIIRIERKESEPKLLFKAILKRHEKTDYTGTGHDLTEEGVNGAIESGKKWREDPFFSRESEVISFHTPEARTKGTSDFVLSEAGIPSESRPISMIGPTKIFDVEAFEKHNVEELDDNPARIAEDFHTGDFHKDHPEIIEPHLKKKERLYRAMEYFIRFILKNNSNKDSPVTQVFAVSHFEIITHLVDDVFGIENTGYRSPSFGEEVRITGFQTDNQDKILLKVGFRDLEKEVTFNRKTRSIE